MRDNEILKNVKEKVRAAMEALEHKAGETDFGIKSLLVRQKNYDLICIKAAAFEAICRELTKEDENWWEN